MEVSTHAVARRPRAYVAVRGPEAEDFLQRMVSNDVAALEAGRSCEALLLTPKARVIAPMRVWRRGENDFLLLTEPELGEVVQTQLLRSRFAAKCAIELEEHSSLLVFGGEAEGIPNDDYGAPAVEVLDDGAEPTLSDDELERMRIEAGTPRFGHEIDDRVLPAEAGLDETAISFTKGCYPGQEPVARQRYRGRVNRTLKLLEIDGGELPPYDAELSFDGKSVGRVTSAVRDNGRVVALAYVRTSVPDDAELVVDGDDMRPARFERATSASAGQRSIP
jgi:tRNA-modifying protein YgfZ